MLRIGIVGCGQAAIRHADALVQLSDKFEIIGCCDLDSIVLMDFQRRYCPQADVFTDIQAMLMQLDMDILLLTTWPASHREQITGAIVAKVPAMVIEKPLVVTAMEAFDVFQATLGANLRIMESNAFVYQNRFSELRKMVDHHGGADTVHATFCKSDSELMDPSEFDLEWRRQPLYGGGVPWEYVSFLVTACNHLARDIPVGAYAYGSRGRYDTITRMHGMIEYMNGGVAFIHSDKQSDIQNLRLQVRSTTVDILENCWYSADGPSVFRVNEDGVTEDRTIDEGNAFLAQWKDFERYLAGDSEPVVPFIHSVVAMYTLDALVASLLQQMTVEIDMPESVLSVYEADLEGCGAS